MLQRKSGAIAPRGRGTGKMFLIHNAPEQAPLLAAALVGACRLPDGWTTPTQPRVLQALFERLLGFHADFETLAPATPAEVAAALPQEAQRHELIELMVTMEMMCRPIPPALEESVEAWARALAVEDRVLTLARDLANQSTARATADFYRLNWIGDGDPQDDPHFQCLLQEYGDSAYALSVEPDPAETARWARLSCCPEGSLGRALSQFYVDRGFKLPGVVGGANPALAAHDWVHVIGDFDTTGIGELEVTAFIAASSRTPGAMLGFVGAVSIYETGLLKSLVTHGYERILSDAGGVERVAAAIRKGARCRVDPFADVDYFAIADQPLAKIREDWGISVPD